MADAQPVAVAADHVVMDFRSGSNAFRALDDVSLRVSPGEFVSIIGPSGCGKTTLLRIIGGLQPPTSGAIHLAGKPVNQARLEHDFAFVFQSAALLEWRDAISNVVLPLELQGMPKSEAYARASKLLQTMGLAGFERNYPRQLSGGMQQRVSIARALSVDPSILLMDEPFGALDEITRDRLNFELLEIWGRRKSTILFVTHNIREAIFLSDRVIVLKSRPGQILSEIRVDLPRPRTIEVRNSPHFIELRLQGEAMLEAGINQNVSSAS